MQGFMEQI